MSDDLRARLAAALSDKVERGATFSKLDAATDAVLAVFEAKLVAVIHGADDYGKELKAERDAALATLARVERAAALADVPDGGDERAAGFNAAMAVVRIALGGPTERPTRRHAGDFLRAPKTGETPTISCEFDASIEVPELGGQNAAEQVPCSFTVLARMHEGALMPHAPHSWQPQPGMTPVWCPGPAGAGSTQDGA